MAKVKIYRFWVYDIISDERRVSKRWGTLEGIQSNTTGVPMLETEVEVDEKDVASENPGLTAIGFNPHPRPQGFQTSVRAD